MPFNRLDFYHLVVGFDDGTCGWVLEGQKQLLEMLRYSTPIGSSYPEETEAVDLVAA